MLLFSSRSFPMHFDEKSMFAGHKMEAKTLKVKPKALTRDLFCFACSVFNEQRRVSVGQTKASAVS